MFTQDCKHNWKFSILFYICHIWQHLQKRKKRAASKLKELGLGAKHKVFFFYLARYVVQYLHRNSITTFIDIRPSNFFKGCLLILMIILIPLNSLMRSCCCVCIRSVNSVWQSMWDWSISTTAECTKVSTMVLHHNYMRLSSTYAVCLNFATKKNIFKISLTQKHPTTRNCFKICLLRIA